MSDKAVIVLVVGLSLIALAVGAVIVNRPTTDTPPGPAVALAASSAAAPKASTTPTPTTAPAVPPPPIPNPVVAADPAMLGKLPLAIIVQGSGYSLYGQTTGYDLISSDDVQREFAKLRKAPLNSAEDAFLKQYAPQVSNLVRELGFTSNYGPRFMRDASYPKFPITFVRQPERVCCLVKGVHIDTVFNTNRSTDRSRAAQIAVKYVLPALADLSRAFSGSNVDRYGFAITYGAQDFVQKDPVRGETLCVCADRAAIEQFDAAEITDQQLFDRSDVFLDASSVGLRKITLKLE